MKTRQWLGVAMLAVAAVGSSRAQAPEPKLPRPGSIVATQVIGDVKVIAGDQTKPVKADERVRVGATITTARRSLVVLDLSNGTTLRIGSESEVELEEFGQEPFSSSVKLKEVKEEPTVSRTRLQLLRGDISGDVKKLKAARGASFAVTMLAGTLRLTEGTFSAKMRMSEIGLGVCTIDVPEGVAEFEPVGGAFMPVQPGKRLAFALEIDKVTGTVKLSPMPRADEAAKSGAIARPSPAPKVSEPAPAPEKAKTKEPAKKKE